MQRPVASLSLKDLWPELVALAALLGSVVWMAYMVVFLTDGAFSYCLDDAYIHMAIAKNLVRHHVWGVTPYQFASASSSPLWILLLALDFLIQPLSKFTPLVLNLLFAPVALLLMGALLRKRQVPQWAITLVLLAIIFFAAWPTVIMGGMEHSLHILLVVCWLYLLDEVLRSEGPMSRRQLLSFCLLAFLMTVCRFEGLFLVFISCALLFFRHERRASVLIGASAWLSVGLFAAFSLAHGWHALPNSVLVKAARSDWSSALHIFESLGGRGLIIGATAWHLTVLLVPAIFGTWWLDFREKTPLLKSPRALLLVFVVTTYLHLQFAQIGWFYRYEAYLMVMGILALALAFAPRRAAQAAGRRLVPWPRWASVAVVFALSVPLAARAVTACRLTPLAGKNIHDQQWQVGRFLASQLGTGTVALNDIGAPSLLSKVHIVDFGGLASLDTADVRLRGLYTPEAVQEMTQQHHVELAIIHPLVLANAIPASWQLIATWTAPAPNVILGEQTVYFYAVDPSKTVELARRIIDFSKQLPAGTVVSVSKPIQDAVAASK